MKTDPGKEYDFSRKAEWQFIARRLHSIVGLLILGAFLVEHFFTNSFSLVGAHAYNSKVEFLSSLPYLVLIEITLLGIPFAFHTFYGLALIYEGSVNVNRNNYGRNWAYVFQRFTAVVVMFFLFFHVYEMRFVNKHIVETTGSAAGFGFYELLSGKYFQNPWTIVIYAVGIAATVFHLVNGLCTFCMTWGLTVGRGSQQMMALVAAGVSVAFFLGGYGSLYGFWSDESFVNLIQDTVTALFTGR